jgi:hypothetical protein
VLFSAIGALAIYDHSHVGAACLGLAAVVLIIALLPDVQENLRFIGGSSPWTVSILTFIAVGFLLIGLSRVGVDNDSYQTAQGLVASDFGESGTIPLAPTAVPLQTLTAPTVTPTPFPSATATPVAAVTPTPSGPVYLAVGDLTGEETKDWADYVQGLDFCRGRSGNQATVQSTMAPALQIIVDTMKTTDARVETSWVGKREKDGQITLLYMVQGSTHFERLSFAIDPLRHRISGADETTRNLLLQLRRVCR